MIIQAVDRYISIRRALGYSLKITESFLQDFAKFAANLGETHILSQTVIAWAGQASTPIQRDQRMKIVIRFARFLRAEDERHEIPPEDIFFVK